MSDEQSLSFIGAYDTREFVPLYAPHQRSLYATPQLPKENGRNLISWQVQGDKYRGVELLVRSESIHPSKSGGNFKAAGKGA